MSGDNFSPGDIVELNLDFDAAERGVLIANNLLERLAPSVWMRCDRDPALAQHLAAQFGPRSPAR